MKHLIWVFSLLFLLTGCFGTKEKAPITAPTDKETQAAPIEPSAAPKTVDALQGTSKSEVQPVDSSATSTASESAKATAAEVNVPVRTADNDKTETISENQIIEKYRKQLVSLEGYYSGQLNGLYGGAVSDLKGGALSKSAIYSKYAGTANALKEDSQAKVNQVLAGMKEELKSHAYATDSVDGLRSTYYAELNKAKEQAMGQVKNALGM